MNLSVFINLCFLWELHNLRIYKNNIVAIHLPLWSYSHSWNDTIRSNAHMHSIILVYSFLEDHSSMSSSIQCLSRLHGYVCWFICPQKRSQLSLIKACMQPGVFAFDFADRRQLEDHHNAYATCVALCNLIKETFPSKRLVMSVNHANWAFLSATPIYHSHLHFSAPKWACSN